MVLMRSYSTLGPQSPALLNLKGASSCCRSLLFRPTSPRPAPHNASQPSHVPHPHTNVLLQCPRFDFSIYAEHKTQAPDSASYKGWSRHYTMYDAIPYTEGQEKCLCYDYGCAGCSGALAGSGEKKRGAGAVYTNLFAATPANPSPPNTQLHSPHHRTYRPHPSNSNSPHRK
ncbi:hypothetical protein BDQ17DRAFT_1039413 [Cyathus striatus]|nr:hypothetical protein BDQ17DRAFT_629984 [Cyathus striatus]KAF8995059.1 hypothetical protein BDQ17DRAFT_1039413 [Cyathus striatus]